MKYYSHNLHFIAMCAAMNGNYAEGKKGANHAGGQCLPHTSRTCHLWKVL